MKQQESAENCIMIAIICRHLTKCYKHDEMQGDDKHRAFSPHGYDIYEKLWSENLKETDHLGNLSTDGTG
jgi:hypothetical protein